MEQLRKRSWLVVYTRTKGELKLSGRLLKRGISVYCPVQKTLRQWSDRKKMINKPVFTSYVFVYVNEEERVAVLKDPLAIRYIYWLGKPAVIRDQEMVAMKSFLNSYSNIQVRSVQSSTGRKVLITEGPFKGSFARVEQIVKNKIRLSLDQIGYSLIADLSDQGMEVV